MWGSRNAICSSGPPGPRPQTRSLGACRPPPAGSPPSGRGSLVKSGDRHLVLRVMARAGRGLAIGHGPQLAAQRLLGEGEAEPPPPPLDQADQPPAQPGVDARNGPLLDEGLQG